MTYHVKPQIGDWFCVLPPGFLSNDGFDAMVIEVDEDGKNATLQIYELGGYFLQKFKWSEVGFTKCPY